MMESDRDVPWSVLDAAWAGPPTDVTLVTRPRPDIRSIRVNRFISHLLLTKRYALTKENTGRECDRIVSEGVRRSWENRLPLLFGQGEVRGPQQVRNRAAPVC